jgi:ketosteroid isomerase-like protein
MSENLALGLRFMTALDANDADAILATVNPAGTWWVDSGLDRQAGVLGNDPGDDRGWPLHATMNMGVKVELLRGIRTRFPEGVRQIAWNSFAAGPYVLIEVDGYGVNTLERVYQNRYAFVIEVRDSKVLHVREYLDTHHSAHTFSGKNLDRRREAANPGPLDTEEVGAHAALAKAFCAALSDGNTDRLVGLSTPDAVWWADSGHDRRRGDRDTPVERDPTKMLVGNSLVHDRAQVIPQLRATFNGGWQLTPWRVFGADSSVVIEAWSNGRRTRKDGSVKSYQNRYCFVLEVRGDKVAGVREYCDTLHAFDVFGIVV